MTAPTISPEALRHAFDEIDRSNRLAADARRAQAEAQKRADSAQALQAAAQVQLKNAEAKYSVLARSVELAAPDIEILQARYAEREVELAAAVEEHRITEVQAATVEQARSALREVFRAVQDAARNATQAIDALIRSVDDIQRLPAAALRVAAVRNMLEDLQGRHRGLLEQRSQYEPALPELETAIEALRVEVTSAEYLRSLSARRERLERDMVAIGSELRAKLPGVDPDDLRSAKNDRDAAKFATEEAPRAVQRAQVELQMASDSLAQAQERQQAAQNQFATVHAEFVPGIEVSAPNAAGLVTARAQLPQGIPEGYTLRWQAGAASVVPETGDAVSIDTSQLPVGDTAIVATLERQPKTLESKA
jgi:chromosome segregation ATPase